MSRIFVAGFGAVSPAGWNVAALRDALDKGEPLPVQPLERPGWEKPLRARLVPNPPARPEFLAHPRLRRTSPITHYAAAAALEAVAGLRANPAAKNFRLGIVVCLQSGCVQYSCRFYDETLKNPATASPLVFPETVYAAPTSHVAALLENVALAYSLVGDPSAFLQGVALGAEWLEENRVDACLVIGAEETNWIIADALRHLDRRGHRHRRRGRVVLVPRPEIVSRRRTGRHHRRAHLFRAAEPDASRASHAPSTRQKFSRRTALRRHRQQPAHGRGGTRGVERLEPARASARKRFWAKA